MQGLVWLVLLALAGCGGAVPQSGQQPGSASGPKAAVAAAGSAQSVPASGTQGQTPDQGERAITVCNYSATAIDQVLLVQGDTLWTLAVDLQPGAQAPASWTPTRWIPPAPYEEFVEAEAPGILLVVGGRQLPVDTARLVGMQRDVRQEMVFNFDFLALCQDGENWYFSPQPDYADRLEGAGGGIQQAQYRYLSRARRWVMQQPGQKLFALGIWPGQVETYFPEYAGEIPEYGCTALLSCETIYLEDVYLEYTMEDMYHVTEVRASEELRPFTTGDVMLISVDHVREPRLYYRYRDEAGNISRQLVYDQHMDGNNGGVVNYMLAEGDPNYTLVPVE